MDPRKYFKPYEFQRGITRYSTNVYYLDFIDKNGNIREILVNARASDAKKILVDTMSSKDMWNKELTTEEIKQEIIKIQKNVESILHNQVDDFFTTYVNQALVMICTVLDTFLYDCAEVITYNKPEILKKMCGDDDITISEVIENETKEEIFRKIQSKFLNRFDFAGFEKKLELLNKMGVNTEEMFILSNNEWANRFPNPKEIIFDMYKKRNDIVHRHTMPLKKYEELSYFSDLLLNLILRWGGLIFKDQFNIPSDIALFANGTIKPK